MEVIAQWLDDLEDMIFALPLAWERLRLWCLHIGLISALILGGIHVSRIFTDWAPTFATAAVLSVTIWTAGLVAGEIAGFRYQRARADLFSAP